MGKTAERERALADNNRRKADALDGAGFAADAAALRLEADVASQHAALCDELDALRPQFLADPATHRDAWKAKCREVHEFRRQWRAMGELAGTRKGANVQNNVEG